MNHFLMALGVVGATVALGGYLGANVRRCQKKARTCQNDIAGLCEAFDLAVDHFLTVDPQIAGTLRSFFIETVAVQKSR